MLNVQDQYASATNLGLIASGRGASTRKELVLAQLTAGRVKRRLGWV